MTTKRQRKHDRLLPMAELQNRPCEVGGRLALFHRWIEEDKATLQIKEFAELCLREKVVYDSNCTVDVLSETLALVEYQDGTVAKVKPEQIRFIK